MARMASPVVVNGFLVSALMCRCPAGGLGEISGAIAWQSYWPFASAYC